jgi:hypothetical protein
MMLHPDRLQSDSLNRASSPTNRASLQPGKQSRSLVEGRVESAEVDALMASLVPQGTSPAKQAIIERLVTLWVAKVEQGIA